MQRRPIRKVLYLVPVEGDMEAKRALKEAESKLMLSQSIQHETDVGIQRCHFWVFLSTDDQHQITHAVQNL